MAEIYLTREGKEKLIKIIKFANGIIFILALFVVIYSAKQIIN